MQWHRHSLNLLFTHRRQSCERCFSRDDYTRASCCSCCCGSRYRGGRNRWGASCSVGRWCDACSCERIKRGHGRWSPIAEARQGPLTLRATWRRCGRQRCEVALVGAWRAREKLLKATRSSAATTSSWRSKSRPPTAPALGAITATAAAAATVVVVVVRHLSTDARLGTKRRARARRRAGAFTAAVRA